MSIYAKLDTFKQLFKGLEKKSYNKFTNSKYADLDEVVNSIKLAAKDAGIGYTQLPTWSEGNHLLKTIVYDVENEAQFVESIINLTAIQEKPTAQGFGSALTYMRRYALCSILGVVESDDDDGNEAEFNPVETLAQLQGHINMKDGDAFTDVFYDLSGHHQNLMWSMMGSNNQKTVRPWFQEYYHKKKQEPQE